MRGVRLLIPLAALALTACGGPDYGAISNRLREANMKLEQENSSLHDQLSNRDATIQSLRSTQGPPLPTLSPERLADLFTAAHMEIQSSTDTGDSGDGHGISRFRVFIRFTTEDGQILPAAGTLTVEAFELPAAPAAPRRIGAWTFTPQQMKKSWYSGLGLNHFAFTCPWDSPPSLRQIVFKAHYQDGLTGQVLEATLTKNVTLPVK